jgi:hypothetical protein
MLDNPQKTSELFAALKAAVPFDVDLTPPILAKLREENREADSEPSRTVSEISYLGDEGSIACNVPIAGGATNSWPRSCI